LFTVAQILSIEFALQLFSAMLYSI